MSMVSAKIFLADRVCERCKARLILFQKVLFQRRFTNGTRGRFCSNGVFLSWFLFQNSLLITMFFEVSAWFITMFQWWGGSKFTKRTEQEGLQKAKLLFLLYIILYSISIVSVLFQCSSGFRGQRVIGKLCCTAKKGLLLLQSLQTHILCLKLLEHWNKVT